MVLLKVDTLEPEGATTTLTVGESGQNTVLPGNIIKFNTLKDAGGNTLFVSDGAGNLSSVNAGFGATTSLVSEQTFTGQTSVTFSSAMITSSFKEYVFSFYNINPSNNDTNFTFQANSGFNQTITSGVAYQQANGNTSLSKGENPGASQGQGTAEQLLGNNLTNDADQGLSGEMHIMNPSSTTYKTQWFGGCVFTQRDAPVPWCTWTHFSGYFDSESTAIDTIRFSISGGTMDGTIKLWGWK